MKKCEFSGFLFLFQGCPWETPMVFILFFVRNDFSKFLGGIGDLSPYRGGRGFLQGLGFLIQNDQLKQGKHMGFYVDLGDT